MANRTGNDAVKGILGDNYGLLQDGTEPSLNRFIDTAYALTTQVIACAARQGRTVDSTLAELIERWLAAWLYTKSDPMYLSRSTGRASGAFIAGPVEPEYYKDAAMALDPCVSAVLNRKQVGAVWLGRNRPDQTPLEDR